MFDYEKKGVNTFFEIETDTGTVRFKKVSRFEGSGFYLVQFTGSNTTEIVGVELSTHGYYVERRGIEKPERIRHARLSRRLSFFGRVDSITEKYVGEA